MTESPAAIERSDVCAVPAAAVVGEAMVAIVLADARRSKNSAATRSRSWSANWQAFRERTAASAIQLECAVADVNSQRSRSVADR